MTARYFEEEAHAALYSKFRPSPSSSLISRIVNVVQEKYSGPLESAVDVGCGSGQSTLPLASHFTKVTGLDISQAQIKEAVQNNSASNITYKVSPAENMPFETQSVKLVTAGQASHWFDLPKFYNEVERILVPNGVLAMYSYDFPRPIWKDKTEKLRSILLAVYKNLKEYFGKERIYVDNLYKDKEFQIPFGEFFREENFIHDIKVSVSDMAGYITTWSGFQNYRKEKGDAAAQIMLDKFQDDMMKAIGESTKPEETELTLQFKFFVVLGRKSSS